MKFLADSSDLPVIQEISETVWLRLSMFYRVKCFIRIVGRIPRRWSMHSRLFTGGRARYYVCYVLIVLVVLVSSLGFPGMGMAEVRHHESHVHGIGKLNIILAGDELSMELISPAANIVGFEHAPKTEPQHQAVDQAIALLKQGEKLFGLSAKAQCRLNGSHVDTDMEGESHESHDGHNDKSHGSSQEHGHGDEHSEFHATYSYKCSSPGGLKKIDVLLFSHFPGFEELDAQVVTPKMQTAVELTPEKHLISL